MKIVSDVGDPAAVVTNAEVAAFLSEKAAAAAAARGDAARDAHGGAMAALAGRVLAHVRASPAGGQSVGACAALRARLAPFGLANEEFVQICNLRADTDDLLERVLRAETLARLSDEQWGDMLYIINDTLEPRVES